MRIQKGKILSKSGKSFSFFKGQKIPKCMNNNDFSLFSPLASVLLYFLAQNSSFVLSVPDLNYRQEERVDLTITRKITRKTLDKKGGNL